MSSKNNRLPTKSRRVASRRKVGFLDVKALAAQQGVRPIENPEELSADFWPDDETADQFVEAVRRWRREGGKKDNP